MRPHQVFFLYRKNTQIMQYFRFDRSGESLSFNCCVLFTLALSIYAHKKIIKADLRDVFVICIYTKHRYSRRNSSNIVIDSMNAQICMKLIAVEKFFRG